MQRDVLRPRSAAIALGLALVSGCGTTASLDAIEPAASSSSTSSGASTTTSADGTSTSHGDLPPDVPVADLPETPPPPGECPPGCTIDLPVVWAWDEDEARPPADPPDPAAESRLLAMIRALDGSLVVATQRSGQSWLTQLDPEGALVRTDPIPFACDCQVIDMALYPSGDLAVIGEGTFDAFYDVFTAARMELRTGGFFYENITIIDGTPDRPGRVGSVIPFDEDFTGVVLTESGSSGDGLEHDTVELHVFAFGGLENYQQIDTQLALGPPRRPKGTMLPSGDLVITLPGAGGTGLDDYLVWFDLSSWITLGTQAMTGQVDALRTAPHGAVVAGHAESPESLELQASLVPRLQPPAWSLSSVVPTTSPSTPVLAVDAHGAAYMATRTTAGTPEAPGEPAVALLRIADGGEPVWSTTVPLAAEDSSVPVSLVLADDDQDLVLAAFVDGRLHVERREQACQCD